ncbi:Exopolyphosphatase [Lachnellula hyalina]|uniref:Exopolyphosphatase n=1 Tax=Lachnellula hyalina TaxID=1316788 RepID=A0A8H8R0T0_9HELO|nr:Exopolyphosphatase [Lachnellula hyalina]TVY25320.1 Exopolyphosphatase [Lachnellula hyalina]
MPLPRASLSSFLTSAKSILSNPSKHSTPLTFIIGNESAGKSYPCTLHPPIPALLFAYLRTYAPTSRTFYIPLSNIPRADLSLRPELIPVLTRANLKPSDLLTLSDLPPRSSPELKHARWVLVDHNALQGELGKAYGGNVVGCVDHHDEEHKIPVSRSSGDIEEPRIVEKSGSCASLVVRYCRSAWDGLSLEQADVEGDKELASLAVAAILVDTQNLTAESKTMEVDREAVGYLQRKWGGERGDREGYLGEITTAKEDIGGLGLEDIFRKDYKQWTEQEGFNIGVSSVVKDLGYLIKKTKDKGKFFDILREFASDRELDVCSIMTTSHEEGAFRRELLVWALNEKGVEAAKKFEASSRERLGLKKWNEGRLDMDSEKEWRRCWWQQRVEHSRKQVAPLLRAAINS